MPTASFAPVAELNLWTGATFGVVGYEDGRAVSATAAFVVRDQTYAAFVATLPDACGRGYAEAVMRHAVSLAQRAAGPKLIWLHAMEMGWPLYQSMEFETGSSLSLCVLAS